MNRIIYRILLLLTAILFSISAFAESGYDVKFSLTDSSNGEPVSFATVSILTESSAKPLKYVLTDADGKAVIKGIRKGTYILKAEMMGYLTLENKFTLSKPQLMDLGELKMSPDIKTLDAATVVSLGNPIVMKKDTIEYTASSFKISDNDMLEALLKKLPGVEVEADGTITANGETIKKITIDGKTFFLDDPQLATKNIPAKLVEKVKVVEKKSDQASFTGIDDGDSETVIDLSVKPGMMNGWFGNVSAGGGHDMPEKGTYTGNQWAEDGWRYQGGAMIGRFTEKSQISILLNGNNSNNRGFNDISGGMMGGMRSRGMGRGSGGWGPSNGITTSWMGGINGNFSLLDGKMDLGGNYLYNGTSTVMEEYSDKTIFKDDGSSIRYVNDGFNITESQGHRIGVRLDHKFSENTSILFQPQFNVGTGSFNEYSDFNTYSNQAVDGGIEQTRTNSGYNSNIGSNKNWNASGFLLFRQKLGKPGRTMSLMFSYNFSDNDLVGLNQSVTRAQNVDDDLVNQRYDMTSKSSSIMARLVYTEPLSKNFFLEARYAYRWSKSTSDKLTYDSGASAMTPDNKLVYNREGEILNQNYSNNIYNRYNNHTAGITFMYQKEKLKAQLGASIRPTDTRNVTNGKEYLNNVINWSPEAMLRYDINDNTMLRLFYFGQSSQPSTSQLMPVPDNSDPLNVSFGNPYLTPYFNHNIRSRFGYTNKQTFFSVHASLGGSIVQDPITSAIWYSSNGSQFSMPLNGPVSGNLFARVMLNSPIAKSKFSIMSATMFRFSRSSAYIGISERGDEFTDKYYIPESGTMRYEEFNRDFFNHGAPGSECLNLEDWFARSATTSLVFTERLRFTYRSDNLEVSLGGHTRMTKSWYTVGVSGQDARWNNQVDASVNWTLPLGFSIMADGRYNWYNGYSQPQDDEFILNAELAKKFYKDKFTLALRGYDLLNQAKNIYVKDEANSHVETRNNTLGRYVLLSLTFRFGKFNNQRKGGYHGR